jgi:hypothetical protein
MTKHHVCDRCGKEMLLDIDDLLSGGEWPGCDVRPCPLWEAFCLHVREKPGDVTSWQELEALIDSGFFSKKQ